MDKNKFRCKCLKRIKSKNSYLLSKKIEKELFKKLSNPKYKNILFYIALKGEVQTRDLILKLKAKKREIFVPFMEELSFKMVKYSLPLKKKKFNIYEPKNKNQTKIKIDIAIVPVVGVDKNFKRIGFGKGMYDRFFEKLNYKPKIIFTQLYPCLTKESITDDYDIVADFYISYNLVCERRKNGIRNFYRLRNSRPCNFFNNEKNR